MDTLSRMVVATGLGASLILTTIGLAYGPAALSLGLAAAAAAGWCAWLEYHSGV